MTKIDRVKKNLERQSRAITQYLFVEMYPSAIPRHHFSISTLIPSLKKINKKNAKDRESKQISNVNQGSELYTY